MLVFNAPTNFLGNFSSAPSSAQEGQFYYNTGTASFHWYNGTIWTEIGGAVGGTETLSTLADLINSASAKTTPVDADTIPITDSAASNAIKRTTWANIKATLKTYFDTLYQAVLVSGTNIKTINSNSILGSGDLVISGSGIGGSTGATDNAILRANGTGGGTVQNSGITIDDTGTITLPTNQSVVIGSETVLSQNTGEGSLRFGGASTARNDLVTSASWFTNIDSNLRQTFNENGIFSVSNGQFGWTSSTSDPSATADTGLKRSTAGVIAVTDGSSGAGDLTVADQVYGVEWNGSLEVPTKNAVYDKIETLPNISSGAGVPASTPSKIGDIFIDTTNDDAYIAVGTASSADWEKTNDGSGGGSVDISGTPTAGQVVRWVDADTIEGVTALGISDLSSKTTPVDADETVIRDSADSGNGKKLSWSNIKATLKTYFDTLYNVSTLNDQSSAYTLVLGDAGKTIRHPASDNNARTFTIPANSSVAYPVGTVVTFINEVNTVTIAITSDTLVWGDGDTGGTGSRTLPAHGMATAIKVSSTRWYISGSGLS